jgi:hypothetical protein
MGYLKPNAAEMAQPIPIRVASRSAGKSGAKGERPARPKSGKVSLSDDHALVRIAERFAPGAQPDVNFDGRRTTQAEPPTRLVVAAPPGVRTLIAVLIVVALLPSLTLAAMLWFGAVSSSWFEKPRAVSNKGQWPAVQANAVMPALDGTSSPRVPETARLDAPATLELQAGHELRFPVELRHATAMPARSVIAVDGLPAGVTLSAGRPYGDGEWNLRPDEIGDLRLVAGDGAVGESTLRLRLVADGAVLATADSRLEISVNSEGAMAAALPAGLLYQPSLSGMGAWDERTDGGIGIAELITDGAAAPRIAAAEASPVAPDPVAQGDAEDDDIKWVEPSAFVNLRKGPSSSADVVGVIAKGAKLSLEGRKRGWMRVTDPKTSQSGWIYAGNVVGEKVRRSRTRSADAGTDNSALWSGLGSWLSR